MGWGSNGNKGVKKPATGTVNRGACGKCGSTGHRTRQHDAIVKETGSKAVGGPGKRPRGRDKHGHTTTHIEQVEVAQPRHGKSNWYDGK